MFLSNFKCFFDNLLVGRQHTWLHLLQGTLLPLRQKGKVGQQVEPLCFRDLANECQSVVVRALHGL